MTPPFLRKDIVLPDDPFVYLRRRYGKQSFHHPKLHRHFFMCSLTKLASTALLGFCDQLASQPQQTSKMGSDDARDRSASPPRDSRPKKQKSGGSSGFKWKSKAPRDEEQDSRNSGRLERGYRDRSPRRDSYRDRDGERPQRRYDDREDDRRRDRSPRGGRDDGRGSDNYRPRREDDMPREDKFADLPAASEDKPKEKKDKKEKKAKKAPKPISDEPMIIVNINDRLGTKAAIPCLASDSVKAFKAIVAMNIGRQPHEIMLKRQGERPFKDQLTLEDYGVSNGVQLDLELDTGD